ncbi:MAG: PAS domain S-box protein [Chitinivibrionales bacterium]|nr:PAS domain S-box protein [Chitinivibrionales bacterium]
MDVEYVNKDMQDLIADYRSLKSERDRLKCDMDRIMNITSGIIYIIDPDGFFTFVNRGVEEILHYSPDELIGRHFSMIMPPREYKRVGRGNVLPLLKGVATGSEGAPGLFDERRTKERRTRNLEIQLLTKEKRKIEVLVGDVTGIMSAEGAYDIECVHGKSFKEKSFAGSQGIIYDITHYKQIEKEKRELQNHLFDVQKMDAIGRFAGGMAHDLNNKLGVIVGFADMLQKRRGDEDPALRRYLDTIIASSQSAAELTSQLLAFAEEGTQLITKVDFNDMVQAMSRLLKPTVKNRIRIKQFYHAEEPFISGDPMELKNSMLALAMRMTSMMKDKGDIVLATKDVTVDDSFTKGHSVISNSGAYVLLTMIFTGVVGDEFAKMKNLDQKYLQGTLNEDGDTGILRIYRCIRKHKGFIEVTNESGVGIKFDIYFPLAD